MHSKLILLATENIAALPYNSKTELKTLTLKPESVNSHPYPKTCTLKSFFLNNAVSLKYNKLLSQVVSVQKAVSLNSELTLFDNLSQ